jgi:hypothetical protein
MNKPTSISQRILQAHCQSHTSQRYSQRFVKELANPTHNRLTDKPKEEHRTDNSGLAKVAVSFSADTFVVNQTFILRIKFSAENRHLRQAAKRYLQP